MEHGNLHIIENAVNSATPIAVATTFVAGTKTGKFVILENQTIPEKASISQSLIEAATTFLKNGAPAGVVETHGIDGPVTLVVDILRPKQSLVVLGAGHVGQSVALIAAMMGYATIAVDDREEFLSEERLPDPRVRRIRSEYGSILEKVPLSAASAVVIVTRGHQHDEACLKQVLRSDAAYVGMIGSKRRVLSIFEKLLAEGFKQSQLDLIHAPIGLPINARSPQEIAISILAEVIECLNSGGMKRSGATKPGRKG